MDQAKYSIAVGMFGIGMLLGVILGMGRGATLTSCYEDEIGTWGGDRMVCSPRDNYDESLLDAFMDQYQGATLFCEDCPQTVIEGK